MTSTLRASDIATAVRGAMEGNGDLPIDGAAGLDEATERHISFFQNPKYITQLEKTKAGVILLPQNTNGFKMPVGKTLIRVPNPPLAFAQVLALFERQLHQHPAAGVHAQCRRRSHGTDWRKSRDRRIHRDRGRCSHRRGDDHLQRLLHWRPDADRRQLPDLSQRGSA